MPPPCLPGLRLGMGPAADDADVCLQHGCDMDEAIIAQKKEAAEVAPELY